MTVGNNTNPNPLEEKTFFRGDGVADRIVVVVLLDGLNVLLFVLLRSLADLA